MLAEMSSEELAHWEILEQLEPFGERAEYMRNAVLCSLLANIHRAPGAAAIEMDTFMPPTLRATPPDAEMEQSEAANPEAVRAIMQALMDKQNGWLATQEGGGHA